MSKPAERSERRDTWKAERTIVLQLLRDDRPQGWGIAELTGEVADLDPVLVERALGRLEREDVLQRSETQIWASRAARCLDGLKLITI